MSGAQPGLDVRTIRSADFDGGQELTERAVAGNEVITAFPRSWN
ncbi:hypothetical protein ACWCPJ_27975 [Streptomyces collinus]